MPGKFCAVLTGVAVHAGAATGKGGLALLFEMVLGGLVGTTPHMISASVMALARLLHQFANELGGTSRCSHLSPTCIKLSALNYLLDTQAGC